MSSRRAKNPFILFMFQQDLENMKRWVLNYPNKETGGDLFGLWSDGGNAVIHIVLGPGRHCTHGDYHFYQDVSYLEKVGTLLTRDYMLGHIGEWQSYHQLRLDEPSEGDCRTVQRNFPQGACGFFLMIANIITRDEVSFSPYIFNGGSQHFRAGQIKVIGVKSPFVMISSIFQSINDGKEIAKVMTEEMKDDDHEEKPGILDRAINFFFPTDETPSTVNRERRGLSSVVSHRSPQNSSMDYTDRDSKTTSDTFKVTMPPDSSFQWYSKKENYEALNDVCYRLRCLAKDVEIIFDKSSKDMSMEFVYKDAKIRLSFPTSFPFSPATIYVNDRYKSIFYMNSAMQSSDCRMFLEEVHTFLQNRI